MDSLSVCRKEASKKQTAVNKVKKKPLEMLVIEWSNIKQGWMGLLRGCKKGTKKG